MKKRLIRQRELTARLNTYRDEYYNQNAPSVSDAVYDRLFDELTELEKETGVVMSNSPTQTVGYPVVSRLPQAKHDIPLLSLDKTKLISELLAFQDGRAVNFSLKLDGLTTEIIYEGGLLQRLSTRGDGDIGEDITHNAEAIEGIPVQIPYKERLVVAGESFIHCSDFERLRQKLVDSTGKPYRNQPQSCRRLRPCLQFCGMRQAVRPLFALCGHRGTAGDRGRDGQQTHEAGKAH